MRHHHHEQDQQQGTPPQASGYSDPAAGPPPSSGPAGVPGVARARLQHLSEPGAAVSSFSGYSDFLLLEQAGLDALSIVTGLSVVHIGGFQFAGIRQPTELEVYSRAIGMGWFNALGRIQEEAALIGADGVLVTQFEASRFDSEEHQYMVGGTAVRLRSSPGKLRTQGGQPFICTTSALTLYEMLRHGLVPVNIGLGICVYHVPHRMLKQALGQSFQNVEVPIFTEGWYTAREIAVSRMQQVEQQGAQLILDATVEEIGGIHGEHTVEFRAFGRGWRRDPEVVQLVPEVDLTVSSTVHRGGIYPTAVAR